MDKLISKIDMTPLVSVALILVIVFVVTTPLIMAPLDSNITLPKAATVEAKSDNNITVSLTSEGRVALNEVWLDRNHLRQRLQDELADDARRLVVIRADKDIRHKDVLWLLSSVKDTGALRIAFATEQRSRKSLTY